MNQVMRVAKAAAALRLTAPVDDDFPRVMHEVDSALTDWEGIPSQPIIVCLCGSTRFKEAFEDANYSETMKGNIVLSVGFFGHSDGTHGELIGCTAEEKVDLDYLHKRKIDLADEVLVLNVGGYIGESTRSEIIYAMETLKPVRYLVQP